MWQSAHATPERAWIPMFQTSNSGCRALNMGAPVSACSHSLTLAFILMGDDVFHPQPLGPREGQGLLRALKIVRHVALAAHITTHLLPRSIFNLRRSSGCPATP